MRVGLVAVALLLTVLAGCASPPAPVQERFSEELDDDLEATAVTGIIRGVVVDDSITPIIDATVTIATSGKKTTTNAEGAFGFDGLEPGTYFLSTERFGYAATQSSVEVVAGDEAPPILRVQMQRIPGLNPYSTTEQFDGYIYCSLAFTVNAIALCSAPEPYVDLGDEFLAHYPDLDPVPRFAQTEMVWESTQPLGETLKLRYTSFYEGLNNYRTDEGRSPNIVNAYNETLEEEFVKEDGLYARVFPSYNEPPGIVLILEQEFTFYTSFFWHYEPHEGWLFIDDSQRPAPPQ